MINAILVGISITQIIGGIIMLLFNYNINIRGIKWGAETIEGNILQIIIGFIIIGYIIYKGKK